jgi:DNA polymerase-3 subunit delta'
VVAAARLSSGDIELARFLLTENGARLREQAIAMSWTAMLKTAEAEGEDAEAATREALEEEKEGGMKRSARDIADAAKRAGRRRRTELLDLGLRLAAAWFRDLAAVASGAADVAYNRDRLPQLQSQAESLDASAARQAAEQVEDTRRRLDLNVSEELALEALSFRLAAVLG